MENLTEKFKETQAGRFPDGLHAAVMRGVFASRYRKLFYVTVAVLCWNLVMAVWSTWSRMVELDSVNALRDILFSDFAFRTQTLAEIGDVLSEFLPLRSILSGMLNLLSIVYLAYAFKHGRWGKRAGQAT